MGRMSGVCSLGCRCTDIDSGEHGLFVWESSEKGTTLDYFENEKVAFAAATTPTMISMLSQVFAALWLKVLTHSPVIAGLRVCFRSVRHGGDEVLSGLIVNANSDAFEFDIPH